MTVGDLILINAYVIQVCLPLNALGFVYREAKDALVNAEKLFQLLHEKPEIDEPPGLPALQVKSGEVVFDNVNFSYEPARPILQNISFRIPPGGRVAVVGGSGSGKSTLARLLLRFYDVGSGSISVDGQDIRGVNSKSLREAIGVVPQDTLLFNDTIAYNIGYGRIGASMEQIIAAAKAAHVHDFIDSLPQKYETPVGERGVMLSGGEKQRIAIARAILKNPPLLIFDEATSALDTQSERAIQAELDQLAQNRTTLVIAHRLSTVVDADEILVVQRGRIVERGTHARLLLQGGVYARLWQMQRREEKKESARNAQQPVV
jgi:ATP-binding cassette subfamily B protein